MLSNHSYLGLLSSCPSGLVAEAVVSQNGYCCFWLRFLHVHSSVQGLSEMYAPPFLQSKITVKTPNTGLKHHGLTPGPSVNFEMPYFAHPAPVRPWMTCGTQKLGSVAAMVKHA